MDIYDEGELVRLRIERKDLYDFVESLKKTKEFKTLTNNISQNHILEYILRTIQGGPIFFLSSPARLLFLIEIAKWLKSNNNIENETYLWTFKRPWFWVYQNIAREINIKLNGFGKSNETLVVRPKSHKHTKQKFTFYIKLIKNIIINYTFLHQVYFNYTFKIKEKDKNYKKFKQNGPKIFLVSRGELNGNTNFDKDSGKNSDYFWINKSFNNLNDVFITLNDKSSLKRFKDHSLNITAAPFKFENGFNFPTINNSSFKLFSERKQLNEILLEYKRQYIEWKSIFNKYNIKIVFSWDRFSHTHMAVNNAIRDLGGISVTWQLGFLGHEMQDAQVSSDIFLAYSKHSVDVEKKQRAKVKFFFITGITRNETSKEMKELALDLRHKILNNGAKKIITVIDEGATQGNKWHTGPELQIQTYKKTIQELFKNNKLGLIFKPKNFTNLETILGSDYSLLKEAEKTGRCIILRDHKILFASLASDLCIHSHLCAGTAALETALHNIPTLLIDREGDPKNILHKLPKGRVVFSNWDDTISVINENFNELGENPIIGNWDSIIKELDHFNDNNGSMRTGEIMEKLFELSKKNLDRDNILYETSQWYSKKWGNQTVIS